MDRFVFIGDDFTGASDTLATLAEAGMRSRLFLDVPDAREVENEALCAVGIATDLRSRAPEEIESRLAELVPAVIALAPRFVHYKVCSTFDSSPQVGSIGAAVLALEAALQPALTFVLGGQPSLGRYCLFGTLFAAGPDGAVHRIDRHPVMSRHPVTPMGEADLRIHLAAQGLQDLELLPRPQEQGASLSLNALVSSGRRVLADAVDQGDVQRLGTMLREMETGGSPMLLVGASSVAEAISGRLPNMYQDGSFDLEPVAGPRLVIAGSRSSATERQVAAASLYDCVPLSPGDVRNGVDACAVRCAAMLADGKNVLVHLRPAEDYGLPPHQLSHRLADLAAAIVSIRPISAIGVAGGDTSSAIVRRLGFRSLSFEGRAGPGVAICRGHAKGHSIDGARLMLKGGQVGGPDLFDRFADR